jgi:diketogulonate reductase-like aldo/keto reductase
MNEPSPAGPLDPVTVQGVAVPRLFYGTAWKEERTQELAALAIAQGFRAIDTANQRKHYFEAAVGKAVAAALYEGRLAREQLFLQTKFTYAAGQDHRLPYASDAAYAEQVHQSLDSSLEHLQVAYVDSLLLHGPYSRAGIVDADRQVWRAMESEAKTGRARLLGVSNVSVEQLQALFALAERKPAFVQNRCYASTGWDRAVRQFCKAHGIAYQGFSLLTANRKQLSSPAILAVLARHDCSLPELVFKFALDVGMLPLTGTSNADHMRLDLDCHKLRLSEGELATIEDIAS